MTSEKAHTKQRPVPFIFQFAKPLDGTTARILRYDAQRQLSQVLVDGQWVDGSEAHNETAAETRLTRVRAETTDDE
jgi:hypothetical protein